VDHEFKDSTCYIARLSQKTKLTTTIIIKREKKYTPNRYILKNSVIQSMKERMR
jgi:hypothetical protein